MSPEPVCEHIYQWHLRLRGCPFFFHLHLYSSESLFTCQIHFVVGRCRSKKESFGLWSLFHLWESWWKLCSHSSYASFAIEAGALKWKSRCVETKSLPELPPNCRRFPSNSLSPFWVRTIRIILQILQIGSHIIDQASATFLACWSSPCNFCYERSILRRILD